jgi:glycosyltransferase involved in cell wall biosynthesis
MPVRNCADTLELAVRSILNQTFYDWELLLLDDGSTDRTAELARSYRDPRIRVFADGRYRGLIARLNQAIRLSRGRYFARMDGDDISYRDRFALQVKFLDEHPEIDLVGGGVLVFAQAGRLIGRHKAPTSHESICQRPWKGFRLAHSTWMGKIEWFRKHRYHCAAVRCEDQELLLRTYEVSRFAAVPGIVAGYREEQLSLRKILTGRRHFAKAACLRALLKRQPLIAGGVLLEQTLKGLVDCFAILTGLNHRLLRHRALPVEEDVARRWAEVWRETHVEQPVSSVAAD